MTDTVNVELDVIQRAVVMAKAIMKAEPLYGCVGYHGEEQINGHVEEAADLACLVLDEMADPVPAPNALAAAPKAGPANSTGPASDELLEALRGLIDRSEEVRDMFAAHPAMQGREHVSMGVAFNNAIGRAQSAYAANHKEDQS